MLKTFLGCLGVIAIAGPAVASDLIVNNKSQYVIHELYVSEAKSKKWGPDQLRSASVGTGSQFTVRGIPDGVYDLKLVDQDDDSCVVHDVTLNQDTSWTLTDAIIEQCDSDEDD